MDCDAIKARFADHKEWAGATKALLREHGFNGARAWSATEYLRASKTAGLYPDMDFHGRSDRPGTGVRQEPGHLGYPGECIFVFDPAFEAFCDEYARQLATTRSDPWLLGHFSDNELPLGNDMLTNLALDETTPICGPARSRQGVAGRTQRSVRRTQGRHGRRRDAFLEYVCERYFRITTQAIRQHDPNHLCLGPRLHGGSCESRRSSAPPGKHLDVIAVNYYGAWTPGPAAHGHVGGESGKPMLITEWYAKGMDRAAEQHRGRLDRQNAEGSRTVLPELHPRPARIARLRGLALVQVPRQQPAGPSTDPSNRDSNKGIVNWQFEPYAPLLQAMQEINANAYRLVEHFGSR